MQVAPGLRQALAMLLTSAVVAVAAAAVWLLLQGGGFRVKVAVAALVIAGLLSVSGSTVLSRPVTNDARAFLGWGPDREEPVSGDALTGLGVFLFVSLPLAVAGLVLLGAG
jgi:hypothetical protein